MIQFYKLNAKNSGGGCSFYYNERDDSFFAELLKQATWDAAKRRGTCDKDKKITIKLSPQEIADMIYAIESSGSSKGYHKSTKVTTFSFNFSEKNDKSGFWFSAAQSPVDDSTQKTEISIPFFANEAFLLKMHLKHLLNQSFVAKDSAWKEKQIQNYNKNKNNYKQEPQAQQAAVAEEEDPW